MDSDVRKAVLYVLRWPFFGVVGPLIVGAAVSIVSIKQFSLGLVLIAVAAIWSFGHWCTADFLSNKRVRIKHGLKDTKQKEIWSYRKWFWTVSILIFVLSGLVEYWIRSTEVHFLRDSVYNGLEFAIVPSAPSDDLLATSVTVTNSSNQAIGHHELSCLVNQISIMNTRQPDPPRSVQNPNARPALIAAGLEGGESETFSLPCFQKPDDLWGGVHIEGFVTQCADFTLVLTYVLQEQSNNPQKKELRFFSDLTHRDKWTQEPLRPRGQRSYCNYVLAPNPSKGLPGLP